ncbi:MAG: DUF308 domain-containing protein [Candidatus Bathyarchaeota archaeon]
MIDGNRKKKDYEIKSLDGQVIAKCYKDSLLDNDSYQIDVFKNKVDLFLVLCYVIVLDLAKSSWTTRDGILFSDSNSRIEKKHLVKTELEETQKRKSKNSESISKHSIINSVLSIIQAGLLFALAPSFSVSILLYGFGIASLVTAFLGVTFFKLNQSTQVALLMGAFGLFSLVTGASMLTNDYISLTLESTILVVGFMVVGFGLLVNFWSSMGFFDSYSKK